MPKYKVLVQPSGLVNGYPWPEAGQDVELDEAAAQSMVDAGQIAAVGAGERDVETRPAATTGEEQRDVGVVQTGDLDQGVPSDQVSDADQAQADAVAEDQGVPQTGATTPTADQAEVGSQPAADQSVQAAGEDDYDTLGKPELQDRLRGRGLPVSGNIPELIERLRDADQG